MFTTQCDEWSASWPDSGMWDSGAVYELQTLEPAISASESSSWPTATAALTNDGESQESWQRRREQNRAKGINGNGMGTPLTIAAQSWPTARAEDGESCGNHPGKLDSLTGAVKTWPTPRTLTGGPESRKSKDKRSYQNSGPGGICLQTVAMTWKTPHGMSNRDHKGKVGGCGGGEFAKQANQWQTPATDSFRSRGGDRTDEMGLDQQARYFPTPASRDYRTPNTKSYQERSNSTKGEQLQNYYVEHHFPSLPAPLIPDGPPSSTTTPTSRRRLNPQFVEWLMGFPIRWTEL